MDKDKKEVRPKDHLKKPARRKPQSVLQTAFSHNLRAAREAAGLTQRELASRTGSSQNHVCEIEVEARNVTLTMVARFAQALGVSELDLVTPKPDKPLDKS